MSMKNAEFVSQNVSPFNTGPFSQKNFKNVYYNPNVLKSINIKPLTFTNKIINSGDLKYRELKDMYGSTDPISILNSDFEEKDVNYQAKDSHVKRKRLFDIFQKAGTTSLLITRYKDILRYKNKKYPEYQLYFEKKNGDITLILIDFYHLGWTAKNRKTMKDDYKESYNNIYSKYPTCISCINNKDID
jgi:hypothetical protein